LRRPVDTRDRVLKVAQALFASAAAERGDNQQHKLPPMRLAHLKAELPESPWEQNGVLAILRFS
jgi:hypothetical protein